MKLIRIIIILFAWVSLQTNLKAQDYTVKAKTHRINNTKYEGFSISIKGATEQVTNQLYTYLKSKSKIRRKRNYYSIAELNMDNMSLDSTIIFLKIDAKEPNTVVWAGLSAFDLEKKDKINEALKKELVMMARSYYVHKQELKIQEAETAAQVVSKKQHTLIDQKSSLTTKLQGAEARRIKLENWLVENELTIKSLNQQLIDNQFMQDSTYLDLQKINKVIDLQKHKLKEIK